jgi:transketolase
MSTPVDARELARQVRHRVLELSHQAHVGHIGSCLSVADILAAVYASSWFRPEPGEPDRDRFVLAKGHAGLALYATLEAVGLIQAADLSTFGKDGSPFGVHPEAHLPGVDFSTGSLGHGLGMAVGAALAARIQSSSRHVVALLSDAECNAGATWEAVAFAGHHRLPNLVAVVDANGQQALGATKEILDMEPFTDRWSQAGWATREVPGNDVDALADALVPSSEGPVAVVARTTFGSGVSFMEQRLDWHYLPMTDEQYASAIAEVEATGEE